MDDLGKIDEHGLSIWMIQYIFGQNFNDQNSGSKLIRQFTHLTWAFLYTQGMMLIHGKWFVTSGSRPCKTFRGLAVRSTNCLCKKISWCVFPNWSFLLYPNSMKKIERPNGKTSGSQVNSDPRCPHAWPEMRARLGWPPRARPTENPNEMREGHPNQTILSGLTMTIIYIMYYFSRLKSSAINLPFLRPMPSSKVQPFEIETPQSIIPFNAATVLQPAGDQIHPEVW